MDFYEQLEGGAIKTPFLQRVFPNLVGDNWKILSENNKTLRINQKF